MDFQAPRGGIDIVEAARKHTDLEVEVQLQMMRPARMLFVYSGMRADLHQPAHRDHWRDADSEHQLHRGGRLGLKVGCGRGRAVRWSSSISISLS